ncbi:MAG: hypothetical protein WC300_05600, partial [Candidatus Omnitrophota bacterium]
GSFTQVQADALKSCMEDFIAGIEKDDTLDYDPGSSGEFVLTARQHTRTLTDEQGRVITNYYVIDVRGQPDSEGNYTLELVSKKIADGNLVSFYAVDGNEDVLVKTIETGGNTEITTIYEFTDGIVSEVTVHTKTYNLSPDDENARLTQWVTETYAGSSTSEDKLASRLVRTGYKYYSDQARGQFYNTLIGVDVTEEIFSQDTPASVETENLTLASAVSLIDTYNNLSDLSVAFSNSIIKPYRSALYGDYDVTGDYGLSGQAIEYYESIYTNIPLRQNMRVTSVWNTDYDNYGNIISSENLNLSFGLGVEQALYSQYVSNGMLAWIDFYKSRLTDNARVLRQKAALISEDRPDDSLILIQQAEAVGALIIGLDVVCSACRKAVSAIEGLLDVLDSAGQDIIDAGIAGAREAIESVMTATAQLLTDAYSLTPSVNSEFDRVSTLLSGAQDELSAAQEAKLGILDLQQKVDILSDTVDIYSDYKTNIEDIISQLYSLKERQDLLAETVPFGLHQQVLSEQSDITYNDLGQPVSYQTKLIQFGSGKSESFAAFYKSGYIYQSVVSFNELITAMNISNELVNSYAARLAALNGLALNFRQSAKDLFDAIDGQSAGDIIDALRDAYRQALSGLNNAVLGIYLDMVDDTRQKNNLMTKLNSDMDEANERLSGLNSQLLAAGRTQSVQAETLIKSRIDALTVEIADMQSRKQSCQDMIDELNFIKNRLVTVDEYVDELSQSIPSGVNTEQITKRRDIVYDINNRITGYEEDSLSSGISADSVWFAQSQAETLYARVTHLISSLMGQAASLRNIASDYEADNRLDDASDALGEARDIESKAASLQEISGILTSIIDSLGVLSSLHVKGEDTAPAHQQLLELYRGLNLAFTGLELEYGDVLEDRTEELNSLQEEAYQAVLAADNLKSSMKSIGTYTITEKTRQDGRIVEVVNTYQIGASGAAELILKKETVSTLNQYGQIIEENISIYNIYTIEDDSLNPVNNGQPVTVVCKTGDEVTAFDYASTGDEGPLNSRTIVYSIDSSSGERVFDSAWDTGYAYENGLLKRSVKNIYSGDKLDDVKGIEETVYEYAPGSSNIKTMTVSTSWQVNDGTEGVYELSSQVMTDYSYDSLNNLTSLDRRGYSYAYEVDAIAGNTRQKTLTSWVVKEYAYTNSAMTSVVEKEYQSFSNGMPKQMTMKSTEYVLSGSSKARINSQSIIKYNISSPAVLEEGFAESALTLTSFYEEYRQITEVDPAHPEAGVKYIVSIFERNAVTGGLVQTCKDAGRSWQEVSLLKLEQEEKNAAVDRKKALIERLNCVLQDFGLTGQQAQGIFEDIPFEQRTIYTTKRSGITYNQVGQAVSYTDTVTADSENLSGRQAYLTLVNADTLLTHLNYIVENLDQPSDEQSKAIEELLGLVNVIKDKAVSLYEAITAGKPGAETAALRDECAASFEDFDKKASEYASLVSLYAIEGIALEMLGRVEGLKDNVSDIITNIKASISGMEILQSLTASDPDAWEHSVASELSALESDLELLAGIEGICDEDCVYSIVSRLVTALEVFNQTSISAERFIYYSE